MSSVKDRLKPTRLALARLRGLFPKVRRIQEGTDRLLFEITPHDSAEAKPNDSRYCPLARALRRLADIKTAAVARTVVYVIGADPTIATRYLIPRALRIQRARFDRSKGEKKIEPGQYHLQPPSPEATLKSMLRRNVQTQQQPRQPSGYGGRSRIERVVGNF